MKSIQTFTLCFFEFYYFCPEKTSWKCC